MTQTSEFLVKETSTTTGTGSYTLAGASTGFRRFQDAYTAGASTYVTYMARMGSDWEYGVGCLSANTTLARTLVVRSSNANAAVNWAAGVKTITVCAPLTHGRHKFDATALPRATDDCADGFGIGSIWAGKVTVGGQERHFAYMATNEAAGSILWSLIGYGNNMQPMTTFDTGALVRGGLMLANGDDFALDDTIFGLLGTGSGGKGRWSQSRMHGLGYSASSDYGAHQYCDGLGWVKETTDATPISADFVYTGAGLYMTMEPDSAILIEATVVARCDADNDSRAWKIQAHIQRNGTGDPALVGSAIKTDIGGGTGGAAAWDVALGIDTTNDAPKFTVTGAAAKTIRWTVHAQVTQVGNN